MFFCAFCWGRRDRVQELRNCGALVSVRVAVLNIDHVDDKWQNGKRMERQRLGRDLRNAEVSGRGLKYVAFENLRSD